MSEGLSRDAKAKVLLLGYQKQKEAVHSKLPRQIPSEGEKLDVQNGSLQEGMY